MTPEESRRSWWVLEYVNGHRFIGRFCGHWTIGDDLSTAELYDTPEAAEQARQALLDEAKDRIGKKNESWPLQWWWDIYGGVVQVTEIERILRRRRAEP